MMRSKGKDGKSQGRPFGLSIVQWPGPPRWANKFSYTWSRSNYVWFLKKTKKTKQVISLFCVYTVYWFTFIFHKIILNKKTIGCWLKKKKTNINLDNFFCYELMTLILKEKSNKRLHREKITRPWYCNNYIKLVIY